jgi:hypothetical protein
MASLPGVMRSASGLVIVIVRVLTVPRDRVADLIGTVAVVDDDQPSLDQGFQIAGEWHLLVIDPRPRRGRGEVRRCSRDPVRPRRCGP